MILKRLRLKCVALFVFFSFISIIVYLMNLLTGSQVVSDMTIEDKIKLELLKLPQKYKVRTLQNDNITDTFLKNINQVNLVKNVTELWKDVNSWVLKSKFVDIYNSNLGTIRKSLIDANIIYSDVDTRGTQLKLLLTLEGNQRVVFKPKWYETDKVIEGSVYAGKDRHGSEILGFYLSVLLNKSLTPIVVQRKISLKYDIMPVSSSRLQATSFEKNNETCVYGVCYYCNKKDPICDKNSALTGAVLFNYNVHFKNHRSPWQRSYKKNIKAPWEEDDNYCSTVRNKLSKHRLYDLIDISIFDFLIQNGDRHHYETMGDSIIYLDNGKGLGNPYFTYMDILAPLYQCCTLRRSTWERLQQLSGGFLREKLELMPGIKNIVTDDHLKAIEDRLLIVYATVEYCKNRKYNNKLL